MRKIADIHRDEEIVFDFEYRHDGAWKPIIHFHTGLENPEGFDDVHDAIDQLQEIHDFEHRLYLEILGCGVEPVYNISPITNQRGLPKDCSKYCRRANSDFDADTTTWMTVAEIKHFNWGQEICFRWAMPNSIKAHFKDQRFPPKLDLPKAVRGEVYGPNGKPNLERLWLPYYNYDMGDENKIFVDGYASLEMFEPSEDFYESLRLYGSPEEVRMIAALFYNG